MLPAIVALRNIDVVAAQLKHTHSEPDSRRAQE